MLLDFLRSLSASIASSQQNIIKTKFVLNASNIPNQLWAGLCCLRINSFAYVFVAYVSVYVLFCTQQKKKSILVTPNILRRKIKPILFLIIWSDRLQKDRRMIHRVTKSGTTSDKEWKRVVQWVTTSDTMRDNNWQRVTANHSKWQRTTMSDSEWSFWLIFLFFE